MLRILKMATLVSVLFGMSATGRASALLDVIGSGIDSNAVVANGTTLWSLVGGVTTNTPVGDNSKNAVLRYYVVATGSNGTSVFSLGEISPSFGGTGPALYVASTSGSAR
jgi:hypothetical protein